MKHFWLKRGAVQSRPNRKPELKKPADFHEILIISDEDAQNLLPHISSLFRHAKISFFSRREQKEDQSAHGNYTYHSNDLNLTGKVKSDKLNKLLNIKFDLIVDLSKNEPLNVFLIKKLNHSFMIGKSDSEKSLLCDLMIPYKENDELFFNEIQQQLTLLSN